MSEKAKKMEGGPTDAAGKPLWSLEEYLEGSAEYVSLARDYLAGPPGNDKRFAKGLLNNNMYNCGQSCRS